MNTDTWQPETIYRDVYVLDLDNVPAGEYQVLVGIYDPVTNERLLTEDNTDAYIVDTIIIE